VTIAAGRTPCNINHENYQKRGNGSAGGFLIIDGLLGFGLQLGPAIFLLYIVAIVAGVLILLGK